MPFCHMGLLDEKLKIENKFVILENKLPNLDNKLSK
ncbi:hypothetical protein EDC24_2603 [Aquisalibacillus elongatus]|uniref:Uncharacterized protein n=1 Tax=Aquisalibacillus elongatus TaxID=485577 RepID=A0A3N5BXP2_9BACI|nr:hypothetical protein EDC24_2603 [Aquisalibacillus elongatus]